VTKTSIASHDDGNPLLALLPKERTFVEWAETLDYDPLETFSINSGQVLESHTRLIEQLNVPTELSITGTMSLYTMLIASLRRRDPRVVANRKQVFDSAAVDRWRVQEDLAALPWFAENASGSIWMGPPGCSKSHTLQAMLRLLPQVIEHGPNADCGWRYLKQLVYLVVPMPADSSRSGLLYAIADALDRVLGTSYKIEIKKSRTVEARLIDVLCWLSLHRCGVLVLEEVQTRNVAPAVLGRDFVNVFLRILNFGVPLVLIGNPLAFTHVLKHSQDVRRLTSGGMFRFAPAYDDKDPMWDKDLVPGVWRFNVLPEKDEPVEDLPGLLYKRTGGIPDILSTYRRECLVQAVRSGARRLRPAHLEAAWDSPVMQGFHRLVEANVQKDPKLLAEFEDQPVLYLQDHWREVVKKRRRAADEAKRGRP